MGNPNYRLPFAPYLNKLIQFPKSNATTLVNKNQRFQERENFESFIECGGRKSDPERYTI